MRNSQPSTTTIISVTTLEMMASATSSPGPCATVSFETQNSAAVEGVRSDLRGFAARDPAQRNACDDTLSRLRPPANPTVRPDGQKQPSVPALHVPVSPNCVGVSSQRSIRAASR